MFIQQDSNNATYQINRCENGHIWINEIAYNHSVIIRPNELTPWEPKQFDELTLAHFKPIMDNPPQILLIGTGDLTQYLPDDIMVPLLAAGIGVECMNTKTACFTYTALICEGRNVAACLIVI